MNTCCSMACPFIPYCKEYNFLVDRGEYCDTQRKIIDAAKQMEKRNKKRKSMFGLYK